MRSEPALEPWVNRRTSFLLTLAGLAAVTVISGILAVGFGPVRIPPSDTLRIVLSRLLPGLIEENWVEVHETIVFRLRVPRVLLGVVVGAGLALVGAVLQALIRNPLGDPVVMGVTEGAAVGAVTTILLGFAAFGRFTLPIAAFLGALGALVLVYVLAQASGRVSATRLLLAGVAVSYFFAALTSFLIFQAPRSSAGFARTVLFWILGGLGGAEWNVLPVPFVVLLTGAAALMLRGRGLNALLLGDEAATTLGVDPSRLRQQLFVLAALLAGSLTAVAGGIGFVGLMVPHITRLLVGSNHLRLLPASILVGATFLVWADVVARTAFSPEELPIGVVTAFIGAPFFIWLLRRESSRHPAFGAVT